MAMTTFTTPSLKPSHNSSLDTTLSPTLAILIIVFNFHHRIFFHCSWREVEGERETSMQERGIDWLHMPRWGTEPTTLIYAD